MLPIILVRCIFGAVIGWTIGRLLTHMWETHQARQWRRMKKRADDTIARTRLTISRI